MHVPVLLAASCWNSFWIDDLPCSQIDLNFQHYHSDHRHQNLEKMFMCCSVLHLKHPNVVYFSTPFTGQNHLFGRLTFFFNRKKQEKKHKKRIVDKKDGSTSISTLLPNTGRHEKVGWFLGKLWFFLIWHEPLFVCVITHYFQKKQRLKTKNKFNFRHF